MGDRLERIIVDPRIMVGKPVIRGTGIPVATIIHGRGGREGGYDAAN
jgi:uncharacterized protein (DUF433 family)